MDSRMLFDESQHTVYAFARCEQWLKGYANDNHLPDADLLIERVAALLHASVGGELQIVPQEEQEMETIALEPKKSAKKRCRECGKSFKNLGRHMISHEYKAKKKMTPAMLRSMRENAARARAAKSAKKQSFVVTPELVSPQVREAMDSYREAIAHEEHVTLPANGSM